MVKLRVQHLRVQETYGEIVVSGTGSYGASLRF